MFGIVHPPRSATRQDLAKRLKHPVEPLYLDCGHNDIVSTCHDKFFGGVRQFLERLPPASPHM